MTIIIVQLLFITLILALWTFYENPRYLFKKYIQIKIIIFTILFYVLYLFVLINYFPDIKITFKIFGVNVGIIAVIIPLILPYIIYNIFIYFKLKNHIEIADFVILGLLLFVNFFNHYYPATIPYFV